MKKSFLFAIAIFFACPGHSQDKPGPSIPQLLRRLSFSAGDTSRLHLLLEIADAYVEKRGEEKRDLDSALLLIGQARKANIAFHDTRIEGRCQMLLAKANREMGNNDLARNFIQQALSTLGRSKTPDLAAAEVEAARYYDFTDSAQNQQRIALYRDAIPIYESAGLRLQQAQTLELLGDCLQYNKLNAVDALPPLLQAYRIYTALHQKDMRNCCDLLAAVYSRIGDQRNALIYSLMAVKQEEEHSLPSRSLCISYNRLGYAYFNVADIPHADTSFIRAALAARRIHDTDAIKESLINDTYVKIKLRQTDTALLIVRDLARNYPPKDSIEYILLRLLFLRVYVAQNNYALAKPYARELIHLDSLTSITRYIHDYMDGALIDYALAIKDYPLARKYATLRRKLCSRNHYPSICKCYYQLFKTDSAQGRYRSAMTNYQQYIYLRDSLQNQSDNHQFLAMLAALTTGANANLALTAGNEPAAGSQSPSAAQRPSGDSPSSANPSTADQPSDSRSTAWRNVLLIAAALLLIGMGLSYGRWRTHRRNRQLQAEKDWLVKELHHRVKNNLQIVMSLLNTQSLYLDNEKAQEAISQSRNRMYALSLIHQRLYQSDDLERIDMKRYIPDLAQHIRDSFPEQRRIVFHFDVDPQPLDVAIAIPVGLILNEAISNSLQWAFPAKRPGAVRIVLWQRDEILLEIADDGVGLGPDNPSARHHTMGIHLMETLVQQLEGSIVMAGDKGARISIRLPQTPPA